MAFKMNLFAGCVLALALASCTKKEEAPSTPAADAAAPATQGAAATPGPGQALNTGTPVDGDATLTAPASAGASATIEVGWTGPGNSGDYIDLVPRGFAQTSGELGYAYVKDSIPMAKLRAPTTAGDYDIRYVVQLASERKVKAVAAISVTEAAATLTAPPKAEGGEPFAVTWTGPSADGDYIDIVPAGHTDTSGEITYAWSRDGNPANLVAPGKSGAYQIRYVLEGPGGRKVLATSPLQVTQPTATLTAPDNAGKGEKIKVEWTGPKRKGDYVDLVKKGQKETSGELSYFYTDRDSTSELTAPREAGEYDIRYVLEAPGGRIVLASRPIHIR